MAGGSALCDTLKQVLEALSSSRKKFLSEARPPVATLENIAAQMSKAKVILEEAGEESGLGDVPVQERLDILHGVQAVRGELAVVARLAQGSAWFASLAREMDPGSRPQGLYGPGGETGQTGPKTPTVERRA